MKKLFAALLIVLFAGCICSAQDWPQYMGPQRNAHSPETGLLRSWSASGPELLWSAPVGVGFGGPVIKDGKVYLLDRKDEVGDIMRCLDLSTGKEEWKFEYDCPGSVMFPGSRSVPIVDGDKVYSVGHYGDFYCFDVNTHKPLWHHNVWKDFGGGDIPMWAISQCPLIYGDLVVVASQAPQAGVVAYNKTTGALVWKTASIGAVGYVSPNLAKIAGEDHIVMVSASASGGGFGGGATQKGHIYGVRPSDGKVLWDFDGWECRIPCSMATDCGDGRIVAVGGYELGSLMIKVTKNSDGTFSAKELWRNPDFGDQTKPAVFHNGYLYGLYRTNSKRDGMMCVDLDGNIKWKTSRNPNFDRGSIIVVDGLMLVTDGDSKLYLVDPSPEAFKMLSVAELLSNETPAASATPGPPRRGGSVNNSQNWAPMALSGGRLLLRDQNKLICVKVTK